MGKDSPMNPMIEIDRLPGCLKTIRFSKEARQLTMDCMKEVSFFHRFFYIAHLLCINKYLSFINNKMYSFIFYSFLQADAESIMMEVMKERTEGKT